MRILITAGGTSEKIDAVRAITNGGTGRLGAIIAERLALSADVDQIDYVCSAGAIRPETIKAKILIADDTQALDRVVSELCARGGIDAVVHSMAVSDYRVKTVTTAEALAAQIVAGSGGLNDPKQHTAKLAQMISETPATLNDGKISSNLDNPLLILERTPKIISMFRVLLPKACLIGFKLLTDVSETVLIDTAYDLLRKNDCDYVLANDLAHIRMGEHVGHLVDRQKSYQTHCSKDAIAAAIAEKILNHRPVQA